MKDFYSEGWKAPSDPNVRNKPRPDSTSTSLWTFLYQVIRHWITVMSGGLVIVALALYERWSSQNVPWSVYIAIIAGLAFLACYLAWRDGRKEQTHE